ncbi:unnamed protein product, partial [Nesidiocoris tenuis]
MGPGTCGTHSNSQRRPQPPDSTLECCEPAAGLSRSSAKTAWPHRTSINSLHLN